MLVSCAPAPAPAPGAPAAPAAPAPGVSPATPEAPAAPKAAPAPAAPASGTINLRLAGMSATSGYFVWHVALGRVISKYAPNVNCTVVEGGGTNLTLEGVRDGFWNIAGYGSYVELKQLAAGTGPFEGNPYKDMRVLWLRGPYYLHNMVRADTGITTWKGLDGEKYWPGAIGSVAQYVTMCTIDATGSNLDIATGSYSDATKLLQDNRIAGLNKSCPYDALDAGVLSVHVMTPLKLIGLTEEEVKMVEAAYPDYAGAFIKFPVGANKDCPEDGDFYVYEGLPFCCASTQLSEDAAYEVVKAVAEHYDEVQLAFSKVKGIDPIRDLIKATTPENCSAPLHAGVVKYCKEVGIEVPSYMIPPEYKD